MATYTDLQNKVKETINVGYKDRITTQPVKMYNEQNEYWGTFKGTVAVDDVAVDGGKIKNVEIYDSALCGKVILPGGTDLAKIGYALTDLCGEVDNINNTKLPNIYSQIATVHTELTSEIATRKSEITRIENSISAEDVLINNKLSTLENKLTFQDYVISTELSNKIFNERKERIEADVILNSAIAANRTLINAESNERAGADALINSKINVEIQNSINRDDALCARLIECEDNTKVALATEHAQMLSTVLHDRHYELYGLADELKNSYPYQLHDFAANILKTSVNDGIVVSEKNIDVGTYNVKNGKTYLHINSPLLDNELEVALIPDSTFTFEGTETHRTGRPTYNSYSIRLDNSSEPFSFVLNQTTAPYYEIRWNTDQIIGTITDYSMNDDKSEFISGKISIYPAGVPELTPFSCEKLSFSQENPLIQIPGTTEEILFNLVDKYSFYLRKGVYTTNYCSISNDFEPIVEFAEILSGNTIITNNNVSEIIVDVKSPVIFNNISLKAENNFTNIFRDDYILSADVTGLSAKFELVNRNAYFNYNVYLSDDIEYSGRRVARLIPGKLNTELSSKDYVVVSAIIDNLEIADKFKGTYELYDDPTTLVKVWKAKKIFESEIATHENPSWIYIEFDGVHLNVNTWNAENCTDATRSFVVKQTKDGYANADALTTIYTSKLIPITEFSNYRKKPTYVYDIPSGLIKDHPEETHKQFKLHVDKTRGGKLDFSIPRKTTEFNDISREFLLTLNVISTEISQDKYLCDFGSDITIFADKSNQLYIKPGRWVTYQFNEIGQNKFLVTDLNDIKEYDTLSTLSAKLDNEIELRNYQYDQLSSAISSNSLSIDDLYKQIKGGLVYQNLLSLDLEIERIQDQGTFRGLFAQNIKNYTSSISYEDGLSVRLRNGFYWIAKSNDVIAKYYFDGTEVRHGDLIVIKDNTTVQDITAEKVSILDIMDKDAVHEDRLCEVSSWLSSDYHEQIVDLSTSLSNNIKLSVEILQNQILENNSSIDNLSILVDNNISNISYISTDIYKNVDSGDLSERGLSGKVEFLLSSDKSSMCYGRTLKSIDPAGRYTYVLSDFLIDNGLTSFLKTGFMFRLSAEQKFYPEHDPSSGAVSAFIFGKNDYFIVNKDILVKNITSNDVDIIYDAANESLNISADLSALRKDVNDISTYINSFELSTSTLSSEVARLCTEISTTINELCTEISTTINELCVEISNNISTKYNNICTEIITTNNKVFELSNYVHESVELSISQISTTIDTLCTEISTDITTKYNQVSSEVSQFYNTLSGIDRKEHVAGDIVTDNLILTDIKDVVEGTKHDKYYLQVLSGTLVLVPIK